MVDVEAMAKKAADKMRFMTVISLAAEFGDNKSPLLAIRNGVVDPFTVNASGDERAVETLSPPFFIFRFDLGIYI